MITKIIATLPFLLLTFNVAAETMTCNKKQSSYQCLVCNCYHEARGEPQEGKIAVAKTVLTRAASDSYPNTVCKVIYQPWQFSWTNDRISNNINAKNSIDRKGLQDCKDAADQAINEGPNGLLFFFNPKVVRPAWAKKLTKCGKVGTHLFLTQRGTACPKYLGADKTPSESNSQNQQQSGNSDGGSR